MALRQIVAPILRWLRGAMIFLSTLSLSESHRKKTYDSRLGMSARGASGRSPLA